MGMYIHPHVCLWEEVRSLQLFKPNYWSPWGMENIRYEKSVGKNVEKLGPLYRIGGKVK